MSVIWTGALFTLAALLALKGGHANRNEHYIGPTTYTAGRPYYLLAMCALSAALSGAVVWTIEVLSSAGCGR